MAIYRPPRSRWRGRLWAIAGGLVVGGLLLWAFGPEGTPSPAERASAARAELIAAEGVLEIVAIEYAESVEDGEVVAEAEYEGARSALARSRARYEAARADLAAAGGSTEEIDAAYDRVTSLMDQRVPNTRLSSALEKLTALLTEPLG